VAAKLNTGDSLTTAQMQTATPITMRFDVKHGSTVPIGHFARQALDMCHQGGAIRNFMQLNARRSGVSY